MQKNKRQKPTIVAVSGGFDPIHVGHVRLFQEAKKLGDRLVVILNNDNWLRRKKGYVFMPEKERKELLEEFTNINKVILTSHSRNPQDISVCRELLKLKPHIFANGGDRRLDNIPEVKTCREINCKMVFNIGKGGKIQSSSRLAENILRSLKNK